MNLDDIFVPPLRHYTRFLYEPLRVGWIGAVTGFDHLDGNRAVKFYVAPIIDPGHSAAPEQAFDMKISQLLADQGIVFFQVGIRFCVACWVSWLADVIRDIS